MSKSVKYAPSLLEMESMPQRVKSQVGYIFTPCYTSEHTHFFINCLSVWLSLWNSAQTTLVFILLDAGGKLAQILCIKKGDNISFLPFSWKRESVKASFSERSVSFRHPMRLISFVAQARSFLYRIISIDSSTSRPRMSCSKSGNRYGLRIRRHNGERVIFLRREAWKLPLRSQVEN